MKYLIVGLGNIGAEYDLTRHNIGFEVLDHLARRQEAIFKSEQLGDIATIKHRGRQIVLLKPSTYMNRSGKAVNYWMQKEKVSIDRLLVITDDLNLDYGTLRLRGKGSDGGHNGLKDINQIIGANYARLRVGIGDHFNKGRQVDYVLGKWTKEESKLLPDILKVCADACLSFCFHGIEQTMSTYNGKVKTE